MLKIQVMKKIFIYTLLFFISTSINSCKGQSNQPKEITVDNINYYLTQNLTATVIKGNYNGNISIPEFVKYQGQNYTIQEIGYGAFENSSELISVKLPATIKTIGGRAFENCEKLKSINIPSSVENIQQAVFFKCKMIDSIHIPESVAIIGEYAFSYCESLKAITVDKNNRHFSSLDGVLYDKDFKTVIKIPETKTQYTHPKTVENLKSEAFENCKYLTSVEIPQKVKTIPQNAFDNCLALTKINIHKDVESIGLFAFSNCKSLKAINVENENRYYSSVDGVLYNFDKTILIRFPASKSHITIEKNTEKIESKAFTDCQNLEELVIPENVRTIGWAAFAQSHSLKNVKILSKEKIDFQMGAFSTIKNSVIIWVPKEVIELYQKSNSLEVKELNYKPY